MHPRLHQHVSCPGRDRDPPNSSLDGDGPLEDSASHCTPAAIHIFVDLVGGIYILHQTRNNVSLPVRSTNNGGTGSEPRAAVYARWEWQKQWLLAETTRNPMTQRRPSCCDGRPQLRGAASCRYCFHKRIHESLPIAERLYRSSVLLKFAVVLLHVIAESRRSTRS